MTEVITSVKPDSRRTWTRRALLWLLLLACGGAAYWIGSQSVSYSRLQNAGLTIESRFLDFGNVWEDSDFHWKLPVRNDAPQTVDVTGLSTSCSCVSITPSCFTLHPGETRELMLKLDLARRPRAPGLQDQVFEAAVVPQIQGLLAQQHGWVVHGRVERPMRFSPESLSFGRLRRGSDWPSRSVAVETLAPADDLVVQVDPTKLAFKVRRKDRRHFELLASAHSSLPSGYFSVAATVRAVSRSSTAVLPAQLLLVEGLVEEEVEAVPAMLLLGVAHLQTCVKRTVVLRPRSAKRMKVTSWKCSCRDLSVDFVKHEAGKAVCQISQRIAALGENTNQVVFTVETPGCPKSDIGLVVSYYGLTRQ